MFQSNFFKVFTKLCDFKQNQDIKNFFKVLAKFGDNKHNIDINQKFEVNKSD